MAAVSAMRPSAGVAGTRENWEDPVPGTSENNTNNSRSSESDYSYSNSSAPRQPMSPGTIATSRSSQPRSENGADTTVLQKINQSPEYLSSARANPLTRKSSDITNRGDLGEQAVMSKPRNRNQPGNTETLGKRRTNGSATGPNGDRDEYWIHRDKLAQIECRELEEAGFRVPASMSRAASRAATESVDFRDDPYAGAHSSHPDGFEFPMGKRQRADTSVSSDSGDAGMDWELRMPEEVEAEQYELVVPYVRPPPRQNGSRIPIKKSGTFSHGSGDRDSAHARSRNTSATHTGIPEPRNRSQSFGSQDILDSNGSGRPHTPSQPSTNNGSDKENSPKPLSMAKTSGSARSTTTAASATSRKPTATKPSPALRGARIPSKSDSPPKRPGTSSGLGNARPSTSQQKQPEGEAPWISSMYKPDPRLPPDQQMLPTHAKRLAQEQWEKEGKVGTVYDREFRLLNTQPFPEQPPPPSPAKELPQPPRQDFFGSTLGSPESDNIRTTILTSRLPLDPSAPLDSPRSPARPGTSGSYKLMPSTSNIAGHSPLLASPPKPLQPIRMPEEPEEPELEEKGGKKREGGCGCVVM